MWIETLMEEIEQLEIEKKEKIDFATIRSPYWHFLNNF